MYDVMIIGAGPAGLTSAIYALRSGKSVLVLESTAYGGQIINTPEIDNYPALPHVSGFDFATALYKQATSFGAEVIFEAAAAIEDHGETKTIVTTKNSRYDGKTVIIATGAKNRPMNIEREQELIGKGVSYCATCDGMFYRKKDVAVFGGGNTAVEDALFLSEYCSKVYIIHRRSEFRADEKDVERLRGKENVEFVLDSVVSGLLGEERLTAVEITDTKDGKKRTIDVSGLFVAIGQMPDNGAFSNVVKLDDKGYIEAGETCETGTPGIYTAGDCRTKTVRQLTTAVGDGAVAALSAAASCR